MAKAKLKKFMLRHKKAAAKVEKVREKLENAEELQPGQVAALKRKLSYHEFIWGCYEQKIPELLKEEEEG